MLFCAALVLLPCTAVRAEGVSRTMSAEETVQGALSAAPLSAAPNSAPDAELSAASNPAPDTSPRAAPDYDTYINAAPFTLEQFARNPFGTLWRVVGGETLETAKKEIGGYADVLVFLLLGLVVSLLLGKSDLQPLLELVLTGGAFLLCADKVTALAAQLAARSTAWQAFLAGFVPVFAAAAVAGGETVAATAYSGFFLAAMSALGGALTAWVEPLVKCYLALAAASAVSSEDGLCAACGLVGRLMKKAVTLAGRIFAALLGIQRVFTAAADRTAVRAGQMLAGAVPLVGQALSGAAATVLSSAQLLKNGLGFAAMAALGVEFVPFYLRLLLHLCLLYGCAFFCRMLGFRRCGALFDALCGALETLAAVAALFFGMLVLGTALMLVMGGG